jgi:hypothetical protein
MQASHGFMVYAKVMLAVFIGLGIYSLAVTFRSFFRPLEPSAEKLAATKKALLLSSWVLFAACASALRAVMLEEYYLLGASALLFSFVLPLIVQYMRVRAALRGASDAELTRH